MPALGNLAVMWVHAGVCCASPTSVSAMTHAHLFELLSRLCIWSMCSDNSLLQLTLLACCVVFILLRRKFTALNRNKQFTFNA